MHLSNVLALQEAGEVELTAVAEVRQDQNAETLAELRAKGVRIYDDYRAMLREEEMSIVSVPAPISLHTQMAMAAFGRGAHVMLEKPPAVLVQDVDRMTAEAAERGLLCQVGFQNIGDPAARALKRHLMAGGIGAIREVVVLGMWRRYDSYYERADWAGKVRMGEDWVLDGPVNNPLIHYMHQGLFLACPEMNGTLRPLRVQAEMYRAHPIEGEDIFCARADLAGGVVMHSYLTLCAEASWAPTVEIVGTEGRAVWRTGDYELEGRTGHAAESMPQTGGQALFANLADGVRGGAELCSPIPATRNVILHNNGCYRSAGRIRAVPEQIVKRYRTEDGETATEVEGLTDMMRQAAERRRLYSEMNVPWAAPTPVAELDFDAFDPSFLLAD